VTNTPFDGMQKPVDRNREQEQQKRQGKDVDDIMNIGRSDQRKSDP
jgi:hypothetical protein